MMSCHRRQFLQLLASSAVLAAVPLGSIARTPALTAATSMGLPQLILSRALADERVQTATGGTELKTWRDPDQLRAWLARAEVGLTAMPTNVAANLYNRGVPLVLLNVCVWGTLGVLGLAQQGPLTRLQDLAGRRVGIPWRGDMPDLVFRYLLQRQGLEPGRDLTISYQASPFETVQMFVAQRLDAAVLPEPARTATRLQARQFGAETRELDLQQVWAGGDDESPGLPQAGVVCRRELLEQQPQQVAAVQQAVVDAVHWIVQNPEAAAELGAAQSALSRPVFAGAIHRTRLAVVPAAQARSQLESFLGALSALSPAFIGGKLPDNGFYLPAADGRRAG